MKEIIRKVRRELRRQPNISSFSVEGDGDSIKASVATVGEGEFDPHGLRSQFAKSGFRWEKSTEQRQAFFFLDGELRPGSGVIRFVAGNPEGPAGTLTCLLSSRDGRDYYFAAAGHAVSNFWAAEPPHRKSSVYHNPKGYPSTQRSRYLGRVLHLSCKPPNWNDDDEKDVVEDIGIVGLEGDFTWKQRTTCYGSFGELPGTTEDVYLNQCVMKCGAEEAHWTKATVKHCSRTVIVYGPGGEKYYFKNQIILRGCEEEGYHGGPYNPPGTPFAVPGDSGTMVVDAESKQPVGMLIAGSVLDDLYVMTPFRALDAFWAKYGLVLLRG
jgi:hypothetical protein